MMPERTPYEGDYHARPWTLVHVATGRAIWLCWEDCVKERPTRFWTRDEVLVVMEEGGYSAERYEPRRTLAIVRR